MTSNTVDRSIHGVTLVEAVLALAILSVSVFVLAETTARCLAVARLSRNYQTARTVLEWGEAQFPMSLTNTPEQNQVAPHTYPNGFTYERELTESEDDERLYLVRTRISWSESGKSSFEEVVSLHYSMVEDLP
ncbi:MAG: hypothetical protein ABR497_01875 [Kiritimatiellia bacterium]|nr:hypothetical protein [Lentisphaerota bacterium]